ncbi:MAG: hypothetical protein M1839_001783 [Geoglossum umbratile]|nr:MAG: hypothetical protein M1839_001783 [Geoglossum umbratile]
MDRYTFLQLSAVLFLIFPSQALNRTVGPPDDYRFVGVSKIRGGSNPANFEFRKCSVLIDCVYEHLSEALKASLSSGTSIAALLPTILALIGAPPLELVQIALLSPHRALATCCFSIGLPSGLFRQLRPLHPQLSHSNPLEPRVREWVVALPSISPKRWKHLLGKLVADFIIITFASIMLWRNWVVNSFTMVPWRCEYTWLLFGWPIACMTWLILSFALLHLMKESIQIYHAQNPSIKYTIWELLSLPYSFDSKILSERQTSLSALPSHRGEVKATIADVIETENGSHDLIHQQHQISPPILTMERSGTTLLYGDHCVAIRIVMPSNLGLRSWRCYEAIVEASAVGIYLYATFVLTSTLFLNADKAMIYATIMTLCLSAVRIMSILF